MPDDNHPGYVKELDEDQLDEELADPPPAAGERVEPWGEEDSGNGDQGPLNGYVSRAVTCVRPTSTEYTWRKGGGDWESNETSSQQNLNDDIILNIHFCMVTAAVTHKKKLRSA